MAAAPLAVGPPALAAVPSGPLSWRELYDSADHVFPAPIVPYALLSAAFSCSMDPPDTLLTKLERTSLESPVMVALVSDEALDSISLVKNPRRYGSSLLNPSVLDGLMYGFTRPDARNLAAVHVPASAFETTAAYNVLDDPATVRAGLEALLADQTFHPYVNVGTPNMSNSSCWRGILLPVKWHARLARDHPFSIGLKAFYDLFLAPLSPAEAQPFANVFVWWRHAATRAALAGTRARSGLQTPTTQLVPPELQGARDRWAQEQAEKIFCPLRATILPLSSAAFHTGMEQLRSDLAAQHATRETCELAQHADQEAREDRRDATQTFEGRFGEAKLEEMLRLLDVVSQDDLPEVLHALGRNKKKSDDALVLQMAIDNRAASPASTVDEYTKLVLSMQIIDAFRTYAWAATGELVTDGITPFNIMYTIEKSAHAVALKVSHLVMVESGGAAMSFADAKQFQESDVKFPATTAACGHHLAAHSIMVDLMMGEATPFAVEYRQCVQQLRPHFDLSLAVHYREAGGEAYLMALWILYWLTQQFLYFLTERKFGRNPSLPAFSTLMQHLHTKTLDGFLGRLPASWMEHVAPSTMVNPGPTGQGRGANRATSDAGGGSMVTNTNYPVAFRKRWQAAGLHW